MSLWETFVLALRNIAANKLRTFLTMLGIIIGVMAVIVIMGLGNGMELYIREEFASLGTNTLRVDVQGRGTSRGLSVDGMYALVEENPYLSRMSPLVYMDNTVKIGSEVYRRTGVTGVSEEYLDFNGWQLAQGRGLQYMDVLDRKNVCVVGAYVNDAYFGGQALGQSLRVSGNKLEIVGVLEAKAREPEKGGDDDALFLPYSTAARLEGVGSITSYTALLIDEQQFPAAKAALEDALYDVFHDKDAYSVFSTSQLLESLTGMINVVIAVLAIIAAISLVVGGIGIMNIMLVSVTERTREIGIRKALGAKEGAILRQFVMEAATTSALGGTLGILLGYLLSAMAGVIIEIALNDSLTVVPTAGSVGMAFGVSAGIGILFGWLPARKAARLNPIDALRYE